MISEKLLSILGCPACEERPGLIHETGEKGEFLRCRECSRRYPVRDGVPLMLIEEAVEPQSNS